MLSVYESTGEVPNANDREFVLGILQDCFNSFSSKFGLWFGDTDFLSLNVSFDEAVAFLSSDTSRELKDLENTGV